VAVHTPRADEEREALDRLRRERALVALEEAVDRSVPGDEASFVRLDRLAEVREDLVGGVAHLGGERVVRGLAGHPRLGPRAGVGQRPEDRLVAGPVRRVEDVRDAEARHAHLRRALDGERRLSPEAVGPPIPEEPSAVREVGDRLGVPRHGSERVGRRARPVGERRRRLVAGSTSDAPVGGEAAIEEERKAQLRGSRIVGDRVAHRRRQRVRPRHRVGRRTACRIELERQIAVHPRRRGLASEDRAGEEAEPCSEGRQFTVQSSKVRWDTKQSASSKSAGRPVPVSQPMLSQLRSSMKGAMVR
jgi:hypothetical protein